MAIIWRKGMSVNNDIIDHDHHFLINFINTVELLLKSPDEKDMLLEVFDQLYDYTSKHFRREEMIQRKIEYPKSLHHKNAHVALLESLRKTQKEIEQTHSFEEIQSKSDDVINFLRSWLVDHILKEDMQLKPYLEKHPRAFS